MGQDAHGGARGPCFSHAEGEPEKVLGVIFLRKLEV